MQSLFFGCKTPRSLVKPTFPLTFLTFVLYYINRSYKKRLNQGSISDCERRDLGMVKEDLVNKVAENKLPGPVMPGLLQEVREMIGQPDISFKALGNFIRKPDCFY